MFKGISLFVSVLGFLWPTLPACAQNTPKHLANALYGGKHFLNSANLKASARQVIERATFAQQIAAATQPTMYVFPIQQVKRPTQKGPRSLTRLPIQADLIPGATFRPHSTTPQQLLHAQTILKSDVFEDLLGTTYSGTIFKDAGDIFGIIPTHTLRWQTDNLFSTLYNLASLGKTIDLEVYDAQGRSIPLRAEVVQLGALQDVSLIKFRPSDEAKLSPLLLRTQEVSADTPLHVQGFNQEQQLVHLTGLSVFRTTSTFMQVRFPGLFEERTGLCGSPALDENGQLAGVVIGHRNAREGQTLDAGYIAPLSSIRTLLEAYRNGGKSTFPLQLNNQTIMQLGVDEWINQVYLFDKNDDLVWSSEPITKFSYQQLEEKIKELSPSHMGLDIFQIYWSKNGELVSQPLKRVAYNFKTQQIDFVHYRKK